MSLKLKDNGKTSSSSDISQTRSVATGAFLGFCSSFGTIPWHFNLSILESNDAIATGVTGQKIKDGSNDAMVTSGLYLTMMECTFAVISLHTDRPRVRRRSDGRDCTVASSMLQQQLARCPSRSLRPPRMQHARQPMTATTRRHHRCIF